MDARGDAPVGLADVAAALAIAGLLVLVAQVGDPEARANIVSQPVVRDVFCADDTVVTVLSSGGEGRLKVPEGGVAVEVVARGEPVPSELTLYRKSPGGDWRQAWWLQAPQGKEIFYVATVSPGEQAYVLAEPYASDHCPARSPVLRAE